MAYEREAAVSQVVTTHRSCSGVCIVWEAREEVSEVVDGGVSLLLLLMMGILNGVESR